MGQKQSAAANSTPLQRSPRTTASSADGSPRQPHSRPFTDSRSSSPIKGNKESAGNFEVKSPEKPKTKRFKKRRPTTADSTASWTSISSTTETIRPERSVSYVLPPLVALRQPLSRNSSSDSRSVSRDGRSGKFQRNQEVESLSEASELRDRVGIKALATPPSPRRASPVLRETDPAIPEEWEQYRIRPESPPLDDVDPFASTGSNTPIARTSRHGSKTSSRLATESTPTSRSNSASSRAPAGHPANHFTRFRRRSSRTSIASATSSAPSTPARATRLSTRRSQDSLLASRHHASLPSLHSVSSRPSLRSSDSNSSLRLDEIVINVDSPLRPTQYGSQSSSVSFPRSVSSFSSTAELSKQPSRAASTRSLISWSEDGRDVVQEQEIETDDDEIEGEEEMGYRRSAPPPSSQSMGWADYSLCPTPRAPQTIDSFRQLTTDDLQDSRSALRNYSVDSTISSVGSIGSIDSAEEVEVRHVMSHTVANSRFIVGTQLHQYPPTEVIQVEFGRSAFGGSTFKRTSAEDSPSYPLSTPSVPSSTTTTQLLPSAFDSRASDSSFLGTSPIVFERPSTPRAEMNAKRYNSKRRSGSLKYSLGPSVDTKRGTKERDGAKRKEGVVHRRVGSTEKRGFSQREIKQWIGQSVDQSVF